jgi:sRNA-binding regulator protein Hfq
MALPNRSYEFAGTNGQQRRPGARRFNPNLSDSNLTGKRARVKQPPAEVTHAENFYYIKQMNSHTPMVIVMTDGEVIHGCIEWYDKNCLKVNREGAPNLVIQKHWIKYVFKQDEE